MRKIIVSFMFLFMLLLANRLYAGDAWITLGYSYFLPEQNKSSEVAPIGPIDFKIGGQITDWLAIDFAIGYFWDYGPENSEYSSSTSEDDDGNTVTTSDYTDINMMPIRLDLLLQPIIATKYFDVLPYIGIGPQISISNTDFQNNILSYGFSVKAGIRFSESFFVIGLGIEYLYNTPIEATYQGVNHTYNGSGIMFGGEVGIIF